MCSKIVELEQKNKEIKLKIDQYKNDAGNDWKSFKEKYNKDIDAVGQAIKNLTVDNKWTIKIKMASTHHFKFPFYMN